MRPAPRGFTLLEVAVAMAILGIAFTALFGQISTSLSGIPRIERSHSLLDHARNKLAETKLIPTLRPDQRAEGSFTDGTRWRVETRMFIAPQGSASAHLIHVVVRVERDGTNMSFDTYRFQESIAPQVRGLGEQLNELRLR